MSLRLTPWVTPPGPPVPGTSGPTKTRLVYTESCKSRTLVAATNSACPSSSVKSVSSVVLFRGPRRRACGDRKNPVPSVARSFAPSGLKVVWGGPVTRALPFADESPPPSGLEPVGQRRPRPEPPPLAVSPSPRLRVSASPRLRPRATAQHPELALLRAGRIGGRSGRVPTIPVLAPFPRIPLHIMQAPLVWFLLAHRVGLAQTVRVIPGVFLKFCLVVAETKPRLAARPAGIFPFRLGREPALV